MASPSYLFRAWRWHIVSGVPAAAFLHSVVQFSYEKSTSPGDIGLFLLHVILGMLLGSVILAPAFLAQAALFVWLRGRGFRPGPVVLACGTFQAGLVALWGCFVGIQPSLGGRFAMGPVMAAAGALAGSYTAAVSIRFADADAAGTDRRAVR